MMTTTIIYTIISLCAIGIASAVILYFVAQKFKVEEDPRIDTVESILPGANCGGCVKPGRSEERRVGKECRSRWSPYH